MSFETEIEHRESLTDSVAYGGHLVHTDGSHTFVYFGDQDDFEVSNPRDNDGCVVNLVGTRSEYKSLDDPDDDLESMRNACDFLGQRWIRTSTNLFGRTSGWEFVYGDDRCIGCEDEIRHTEDGWTTDGLYLHTTPAESADMARQCALTESGRHEPEPGFAAHLKVALPRPMYSGGDIWLDLIDEHESFAALGYLMGWDAEECMREYVARHRPDIAHYEHHWQVSGSSQSDWNEGWAYVTWDALAEFGIVLGDYYDFPEDVYKGEFEVYSLWFGGDVYYAVHVAPGELEFEIGPEGGYYLDTHEYTEDSCGGLLGYENFGTMAAEIFGASEVVS